MLTLLLLLLACAEDCTNGADDDNDGHVDAADQDCEPEDTGGCCVECSAAEGMMACGQGCTTDDVCLEQETCACDVE